MWARKGRAPSGAQRNRHWWRSAAARLKVAAVVQEDAEEEEEEEEEPASRPCCCTSHVTGPRSASAWPGEGWKVIMITENSAYFGVFFIYLSVSFSYLFKYDVIHVEQVYKQSRREQFRNPYEEKNHIVTM